MKIAFKVLQADKYKAAIQIENQYFLVSDLYPLLNNLSISEATEGTDDLFYIYLEINKLVQSAGTLDGSTFTVSTDWQRLDNNNVETYRNFQKNVTVAKFVKGTTYLIPRNQFAPLNMIPSFPSTQISVATGTDSFVASKFLYQCPEDVDILNDVDVSGVITCEYLGAVAFQASQAKAQRKAIELSKIAVSTGVPVGQNAAVLSNQKLLG